MCESPLETRTRFKEDCDARPIFEAPVGMGNEVGNQDSLQRGLRPICTFHPSPRGGAVGNQDSLQRGLRQLAQSRWVLGGIKLETRTRFKEDCDARYFRLGRCPKEVGNQDSLQRGLRPAAWGFMQMF